MVVYFKYTRILLIASLIVFSTKLHSQKTQPDSFKELRLEESILFRHLTDQEGLLDSPIDILKDSRGFVWFLHRSSLQRFDGITFKNFFFQPGNARGLLLTEMTSIEEDRYGFIWIGGLEGIVLFDPVKETFTKFSPRVDIPSNLGFIKSIERDFKDNIWIGSMSGLFLYDRRTDSAIHIYGDPFLEGDTWTGRISFDRDGNVWGLIRKPHINKRGVFKYDINRKILLATYDHTLPGFESPRYSRVVDIAYDKSDHSLWLSYGADAFIENVSISTGTSTTWSFAEDLTIRKDTGGIHEIENIDVSDQGVLLVHLSSGHLIIYRKAEEDLKFVRTIKGDRHSYWGERKNKRSSPYPLMMFGNECWSASDNGVNYFSLIRLPISHRGYPNDLKTFTGVLTGAYIHSENSYFLKSESGLAETDSLLNLKRSKQVQLAIQAGKFKDGRFYTGQLNPRVFWSLDLNTWSIRPERPLFSQIRVLGAEIDSGEYWGLKRDYIVKIDENEVVKDSISFQIKWTPSSMYYERKTNQLWIALWDSIGLSQIDLNSRKVFRQYKRDYSHADSLWVHPIFSIKSISDEEVLLIGRSGADILNIQTGRFLHLGKMLDLGTTNFTLAHRIHKNHLWLVTEREIVQYNFKNRTYRKLRYNKDFKWQINAYSNFDIPVTQDGRFLVFAKEGLLTFDPDLVFHSESTKPALISEISLNSNPVLAISQTRSITVNEAKLKELTIRFSNNDMVNQENSHYEYALIQESDTAWSQLLTPGLLTLSKVRAGNYTLLIRSRLGENKNFASITSLKIFVQPPFWRTASFTIIAGCIIVSSVFFLVRRRIKIIQSKEKEKVSQIKKYAELELQSLRAQLNPHFMFNSLNAIQELILREENEASHTYLTRFAKLLRILVENADKAFIPIAKEIEFLRLYLSLETLRLGQLEFKIDADPSIDLENTLIPNMILQPYIENALWHGLSPKEGEKKIHIKVSKSGAGVCYVITDNGIGRQKAAELKSRYRSEHRSRGMELLERRFKLLNEEYGSEIDVSVTDMNENGNVGTRVQIQVPEELNSVEKALVYDKNNHN